MDNPHNERQVFVYCITNTVSGKRYYGICASKVQRRWRRHCNSAAANKPRNRNCPALHSAIRKYGEAAFSIETVYEAVNWFEACKVERGLIAQHGTLAPLGYNLTSGGEGRLGVRMSEDLREENRQRSLGRKHSVETRVKMSRNMRGRKLTDEHRAGIGERTAEWWAVPANHARMSAKAKAPDRIATSRANVEKAIASNFGRSPGDETRAKMSQWQMGKKLSDETKSKIGAKATGRKKTPEQIEAMRQREFSPEHRAKIRASLKGREFSPEWRAKITEGLKRRWDRWREARDANLG